MLIDADKSTKLNIMSEFTLKNITNISETAIKAIGVNEKIVFIFFSKYLRKIITIP